MIGFIVLLLVIAIGLQLWAVISPRGMWETTAAWRYRDPEAHRPSDAQFAVTRVAGVVLIVLCAIMIPLAISLGSESQRAQEEEDYQDCLDEHRDTDGLLSPEDWCANLDPDDSDDSDGSDSDSDSEDWDDDSFLDDDDGGF